MNAHEVGYSIQQGIEHLLAMSFRSKVFQMTLQFIRNSEFIISPFRNYDSNVTCHTKCYQ